MKTKLIVRILILIISIQFYTGSLYSQINFNYSDLAPKKVRKDPAEVQKISSLPGNTDSLEISKDYNINVFLNQTYSTLNINIEKIKPNTVAKVTVLSIKGDTINYIEKLDAENKIELSTFTKGMYILKLNIDGMEQSWILFKNE